MLRKLLGLDRLEYRIAKQGKQLNRIERMLAEMNRDAASADKRQILKSHFPLMVTNFFVTHELS